MTHTLAPATPVPLGIGYYLTSADMGREPSEVVRRLQHSGARWLALWLEAPDGRVCSPHRLEVLSSAARDLAGCAVWLWSFPSAAVPQAAGERLGAAARRYGAHGVILDVERPPRPTDGPEWTAEAARILVRATLDGLREGIALAVSSYPLRSAWADRIPWDDLAVGIGMPQLYRSAERDGTRERALREWTEAHGVVVPTVASYLGDHERLRSDLVRVCLDADGRPRVPAVGVWSLASTDGRERAVLRETASAWGW